MRAGCRERRLRGVSVRPATVNATPGPAEMTNLTGKLLPGGPAGPATRAHAYYNDIFYFFVAFKVASVYDKPYVRCSDNAVCVPTAQLCLMGIMQAYRRLIIIII